MKYSEEKVNSAKPKDLSKLDDNIGRRKAVCNLHLFIPTMTEDSSHDPITDHNGEVLYYGKSFFIDELKQVVEFNPDQYAHFQLVVNKDGTLWYEANRYLLDMLDKDTAYYENQRVSKKTLSEHASALQNYKWWCDEQEEELRKNSLKEAKEQLPYWRTAKRPTSRPNIAYKKYLLEKTTEDGKPLSPKTVKKYISPITSFYNFINEHYGAGYLDLGKGVIMPGKEVDHFVKTNYGTRIVVGNEANRVPYADNKDNGYIKDGGNTKPLSDEQQKKLFELIFGIGNPEITLMHLFAIETAARVQTVLTLRLRHFMKSVPADASPKAISEWRQRNDAYDSNQMYTLSVGGNELVDTKGLHKEYKLQVPGDIMRAIQRYCVSERAFHRRSNLNHPQPNPLDEYVFITKNGNPYYCSKSDPNKDKYSSLPDGVALRNFNKDCITPFINFEYKFHFLRASALWNMLQVLLETGMSQAKALQDVRDFAGHKDASTTSGYLNWKPKEEARYRAIESRAKRLYKLVDDTPVFGSMRDGIGEEETVPAPQTATPHPSEMTQEEMLAEIARLKAENERLKNGVTHDETY